MQNLLFFIFCLTMMSLGCQVEQKSREKLSKENFNCTNGLMQSASYEQGIDEPIPPIKNLSNSFIIVVDTNLKATNFVSVKEDYSRKRSKELDTAYLSLLDPEEWEKLSVGQKIEKLAAQKNAHVQQANYTHAQNNQGQNQIWIINNTADTVSVQMEDWSYICILQGLTKSGQWCPIQYWRLSNCGNSYYYKHFPPKTASSFVMAMPNRGNYETKLRFKLLGTDKFYYSNEFTGKIDYCDFFEDNSRYYDNMANFKSHYKLDSIIRLVLVDTPPPQ